MYSGDPPYGHLGNTVASLLRPRFFARQNGRTFSYKKTLVNTANGHILKSQTVESFIISHR